MTDEEWFDALWHADSPVVWAFAARRVDSGTADDIVAETFLAAWRHRAERVSRPWLLRAAYNVIGTRYRSEDRRRQLVIRIEATNQEAWGTDPAETFTDRSDLVEALSVLNLDELEAILLVAWDGFTPGEAAVVAGCGRSAFRMRLMRARRQLRALASAGTTTSSETR